MGRPPAKSLSSKARPKGLSASQLQVLQLREDDLVDLEPDFSEDKDLAYQLLDYVEQFFLTNGYVPSVEFADERLQLKPDLYRRWITSRPWREKLAQRGVYLPGVRKNLPEDALTSEQLSMIKVMTNPLDTRSYKKKLADNSVEPLTWQAWMADPRFVTVLHARAEQMFTANQYEALLTIMDNTREGDLASAKLYLEMTGRYSAKAESLNIPLAQIINLIVEIIQDEVKDSALLSRIGSRMMGVVAAAVQSDQGSASNG